MKKLIIAALALLCVTVPGRAQNKIAVRPIGQTVVSFSATPTFGFDVTNAVKITLTANVTSSTAIGLEAGQHPVIEVCQDGTGSRTFAFPAQFAGAIAVLPGANACIAELFYFDGTTANIITTTTAGGGGSGTINSGTGKCFTWYATTGTTVSGDCNLDDGLTTAATLTYAGAGGISATQYRSTGSGAWTVVGDELPCSGAAATKIALCAGDPVSKTFQISNDGDSFRSAITSVSTSPVPHGPLVAGTTFPQAVAISRGAQGQPLLEGSGAGDPGYGQLDLSLSTNVINRLVKANQTASTVYNDQVNAFTVAGTLDLSASTVASAFRLPNAAGCTVLVNGAQCYDTTSNNVHFGVNGADSRVFIWTGTAPVHHNCLWAINVSGHVEAGDSGTTCGGGSTPRLDQVLSANAAWSTANGDNPFNIQFASTTSGRKSFRISEISASVAGGTPYHVAIDTLAGSTANPITITAQGTANGIRVNTSGILEKLGTGSVDAGSLSSVVPIANGGLNNNAAPSSDGQIPIWNAASSKYIPGDPITSGNQAAATTQTITATGALTGVTVTGIGTVLVTVSGTYAGVAFNFEGTPDGTFSPAFPVSASQLDAASVVSVSGTLGANTTRSWLVDAAGFTKIRLNATAYTSGTANVTITPVYHQFVPWTNANIVNIPAVTQNGTWTVQPGNTPNTSPWLFTPNDGAGHSTPAGDSSARSIHQTLDTAIPAGTAIIGKTTTDQTTHGTTDLVASDFTKKAGSTVIADPCEVNAKVYDSFSGTANTQLITGTSAKKIYFCSFTILTGAATNIAIVEGTGTVCATGIAKFPGLSGGTTAATGWNFSANGGLTYGNGSSSIAGETTNADNVCVLVSAANQTNISYSYVVQ